MLPVVLVVDVANVMGSRPDGWWKDRAGAAARLVAALVAVAGQQQVRFGDVGLVTVTRLVAVVEGQARGLTVPDDVRSVVEIVAAERDGDSAVVEVAAMVLAGPDTSAEPDRAVPLVVTADRGLRDRLPAGCLVTGPRSLLNLL